MSIMRVLSSDEAHLYEKGVGAEDSHVKGCIRRGKIRFIALSRQKARRAIGSHFFDIHLMIALPDCHFFMLIHKRQAKELYFNR